MFLAFTEFGIDPESRGNVVLWDQNNTPISPQIFSVVVLQYLQSNSFAIKIGIKSDPNEPLLVQVSPFILTHILLEKKRTTKKKMFESLK